MAENIEFRLRVIEDKLGVILEQNEKKAKKVTDQLGGIQQILGQIGDESQKIKEAFLGSIGSAIVQKGLSSIQNGFNRAVDEARQFSRSVAEINSVLPQGTKLTRDQEQALAKLSERYGTTAVEQAKGFFEAVSNGIEDTAKAGQVLTAANDAALSGLVDLNTATKVITSTLNAYAAQGVSAAQVTDTLVAVTQVSGVKFEEIAQTLGRVTNTAAQSGVSIGELGGTIAFLNQRSLTTEQAVTGLAGILAEVSKPSNEASIAARSLGIEFNSAALKAKGLVPFLQDVAEKTGGNVTNLRQLFGDQRAANAVIAIATSEFSKYADAVDRVTKSSGEASRASKQVKDSLDFKLSELSSTFNSLAIAVGNKAAPAIDSASKTFKLFRNLIDGGPKSIDENRNRLKELGLEYNSLKDRVAEYNKTEAGANSEAKIALERRLNEILKERQAIRQRQSQQTQQETDAASLESQKRAAEEAQVLDVVVRNSRIDSYNQMIAARENFDAFIAEREFAAKIAALTANEEDLNQFIAAEQAKVDAKFASEEQKAKLIADSLTKEQTLKAIASKKELELEQAKTNAKLKIFEAENKLRQRSLQTQLDYIQAFGNLASAIAKDGSKEQFLIQKSAAIAQSIVATNLAAAQALASPPGPPITIPLAATAKTLGAINTAAIAATAIKGFAEGGIVGNQSVATSGPDNTIIKARNGEAVLTADDQLELLKGIRSGLLSQSSGDVIIQIDGREIVRAVNNQLRSGARLAT